MPRVTVRSLQADNASLAAENARLRAEISSLQAQIPKPRPRAEPRSFDQQECPICYEALTDVSAEAFPCGHELCYRCKDTHLKAHAWCLICRAPASRLDVQSMRNPVISRGRCNLHGESWPEIGEVVVLQLAGSVHAGIVHGYTADRLLVKYGRAVSAVDPWFTEVYNLQYLVDRLPPVRWEENREYRTIRNGAQFMPHNF